MIIRFAGQRFTLSALVLVLTATASGCDGGDDDDDDGDTGSVSACDFPPGASISSHCIEYTHTDRDAVKSGCESLGGVYHPTQTCSDLHGADTLAGTCLDHDPTLGPSTTYYYNYSDCSLMEPNCEYDGGEWTDGPGCSGGSGGSGTGGQGGGA